MRYFVVLTLLLTAGCAELNREHFGNQDAEAMDELPGSPAESSSSPEAAPELPTPLPRAVLEGCSGSDPGPVAPLRVLPWKSPRGFERPHGVIGEAKLLAYHCSTADIFGLGTVQNISFAIEGHSNVSDAAGAFSVNYNGMEVALAIYTNQPAMRDALAYWQIDTNHGDVGVDKDRLELSLAAGGVRVDFTQQEDLQEGGTFRYTYLVLAKTEPIVGILTTLEWRGPYIGIHTTVTANGDSRLAEWDLMREGASTRYSMQENATITLEIIVP